MKRKGFVLLMALFVMAPAEGYQKALTKKGMKTMMNLRR